MESLFRLRAIHRDSQPKTACSYTLGYSSGQRNIARMEQRATMAISLKGSLWSGTMTRLYATMAILLLSGGVPIAQGTGATTTSGTTGQAAPASPGGLAVGLAPGANPNNAEDMTNRGNSQDRSQPNASNPQLMSPSPPVPVVK
jgi:hypothetical protein